MKLFDITYIVLLIKRISDISKMKENELCLCVKEIQIKNNATTNH